MRLDIPRAQTARVQSDDFMVESRKPALVLRNQRWVEASVPIAGNRQLHFAVFAEYRLLTRTVAMIAGLLLRLRIEMDVHLRMSMRSAKAFLSSPSRPSELNPVAGSCPSSRSSISLQHEAGVTRLHRSVVGMGDKPLERPDLRLRYRHWVFHDDPPHAFGARRCGQRPVIAEVLTILR